MADKTKRVDYFTVEIPNQPGETFRVLAKLKEGGVNFLSITGFPTAPGKGQMSLLPENADTFVKAAKSAGLTTGPAKKALFVQGGDRVGAAAEVFKKLSDAKINVAAFNASAAQGSFGLVLWFAAKDVDAAAKVLGA